MPLGRTKQFQEIASPTSWSRNDSYLDGRQVNGGHCEERSDEAISRNCFALFDVSIRRRLAAIEFGVIAMDTSVMSTAQGDEIAEFMLAAER